MAEQKDIRENQMNPISNPAYLRCLDSAGNSGVVAPGNLPYSDKTGASTTVRTTLHTGKWYRIAVGNSGGNPSSGLFSVANSFSYMHAMNVLFYAFAASYQSIPTITKIAASGNERPISKARVVFASDPNPSFLDIYINSGSSNDYTIAASCLIGFKLQTPVEVSEALDEGYSSKEVSL